MGPLEVLGALFSGIATPDAAHYFVVDGTRLPLPARTSGIFAGLVAAALIRVLAGAASGARPPRLLFWGICFALVGAGAFDGLHALLGEPAYRATLETRYWAGVALGAGGGFVFLPYFHLARGSTDLSDPFETLEGGVGALAIVVLLCALLRASVDVTAWLLALVSSGGLFYGAGVALWLPLSQGNFAHIGVRARALMCAAVTVAGLLLLAQLR